MSAGLRSFDLRVRPLSDVLPEPPEVAEDGWNAEDNAARKAHAYWEATKLAVLSLDYALAFARLPAQAQPNMSVRRIPGVKGRAAADDEVLDYYSALFASHGGRLRGRWDVGAAVATPAGRVERTTIVVHRTFISQPSARRIESYPLASLQLVEGGTYVSKLTDREEERLLQRVLGEPLHDLVADAVGQAPQ